MLPLPPPVAPVDFIVASAFADAAKHDVDNQPLLPLSMQLMPLLPPPLLLAPLPSLRFRSCMRRVFTVGTVDGIAGVRILPLMPLTVVVVTVSTFPADSYVDNQLPLQSVAKLRHACTSAYEQIIRALLEQNSVLAMQFLVELREDLLQWLPWLQQELHTQHHNPSQQHSLQDTEVRGADLDHGHEQEHDQHELLNCLKQLDSHLRTLFSTWFSNGMLQVWRITYHDTPAAIIETIAKQESVHPMRSLDDLRNRLSGQDSRVFGLFHPLLPEQPLVVLYVSLQPTAPKSMTQVHKYYDFASSSTLMDDQEYTTTTVSRVATFYFISNLQPGLAGFGLGEYLIQQAVERIRSDVPTVNAFFTLSPLPRFTKWLKEKLVYQQQGDSTGSINKFWIPCYRP